MSLYYLNWCCIINYYSHHLLHRIFFKYTNFVFFTFRQWEQFSHYPMFNPLVPIKPPVLPPPVPLSTAASVMGMPPFSVASSGSNIRPAHQSSYRLDHLEELEKEKPAVSKNFNQCSAEQSVPIFCYVNFMLTWYMPLKGIFSY